MDKENKVLCCVFIIVIVFIIIAIIIGSKYSAKQSEIFQEKVNNCWKKEGCNKYNCLANLISHVDVRRNYLLQEQNCLLKENKDKKKVNLNEDLYCYSASSEPECPKIILKNGTEIIEYPCFQNANMILKCINKSEIKEINSNL